MADKSQENIKCLETCLCDELLEVYRKLSTEVKNSILKDQIIKQIKNENLILKSDQQLNRELKQQNEKTTEELKTILESSKNILEKCRTNYELQEKLENLQTRYELLKKEVEGEKLLHFEEIKNLTEKYEMDIQKLQKEINHLITTKEIILMDNAAKLHEKELQFQKEFSNQQKKFKDMVLHYEEKHQSLNNEVNLLKSEKLSRNDKKNLLPNQNNDQSLNQSKTKHTFKPISVANKSLSLLTPKLNTTEPKKRKLFSPLYEYNID